MRIIKVLLILCLAQASLVYPLVCCMDEFVQDQSVMAANSGFSNIVIDPNPTCDTAGISWSVFTMRYHNTYRLKGEDLITTTNVSVSGIPLETLVDTSEGWCSISIEKLPMQGMSEQLRISPNPAHSWITMSFPNSAASAKLEIFDARGTRVFVRENIVESAFGSKFDQLENGVFFVRITSGKQVFINRFVKQ